MSRKSFHMSRLAPSGSGRAPWQGSCAPSARTIMRKARTIAVELAQAPSLAWILLAAELAAAIRLLSSGLAPDLLVRCLQVFLRF